MVVVDADHRFQEVLHLAEHDVYELSETRSDNVDPNQITKKLGENMPASGVETIVVDSLTAIITPLVVQAMVDHDEGREKNLSAAFRTKALAMRQIQDAVTRWGTDVLWIYHLQDSRDSRAKEITRATISQTELARLSRSINVQLEVILDERNERRGIQVVWARRGRSGMTIWDESGHWEGDAAKDRGGDLRGVDPQTSKTESKKRLQMRFPIRRLLWRGPWSSPHSTPSPRRERPTTKSRRTKSQGRRARWHNTGSSMSRGSCSLLRTKKRAKTSPKLLRSRLYPMRTSVPSDRVARSQSTTFSSILAQCPPYRTAPSLASLVRVTTR